MPRPILACSLLAGVLLTGLTWSLSAGRTAPPAHNKQGSALAAADGVDRVVPVGAKVESRVMAFAEKLAQPCAVDFSNGLPLKEALEYLSAQYDMNIIVDNQAFKVEGSPEPENSEVKLPKVTSLKLGTVLQKLLSQVQATYLLRPDRLEVTTLQKAGTEVWGTIKPQEDASAGRPRLRMVLVTATFEQRPLHEALQTLAAAATGTSVVLDTRRAGDRAKATVTATLNNVPLDTAVRVLADQAALSAVLLDDALYVSRAEHVESVQAEHEKAMRLQGSELPSALAIYQKMMQPTRIDLDKVPLRQALRQLAREADINVLIDPRVEKESQTPITMQLKDASLQTAVRLMGELAGVKPIIIGNAVFVTDEASANKLKADPNWPTPGAGIAPPPATGGMLGVAGGGNVGAGAGLPGVATSAGPPIVIGNVPSAPAPNDRTAASEKPERTEKTRFQMNTLLQPLSFDGFGPNTPLKDAVDFLQEKAGLTILVDGEAFKTEGGEDVEAAPVQLSKMTRVRVATVVQLLAAQVEGECLVKTDHLEITSRLKWNAQVWGDVQPSDELPGRQRPRMELVHASIEQRPLMEALQELSDLTGISVVLDVHRSGDGAKTPVTGQLVNVPLDTAVHILADQAGLSVVLLDDVLYVTTADHARVLQAEQQRLNRFGLALPASSPVLPGGT